MIIYYPHKKIVSLLKEAYWFLVGLLPVKAGGVILTYHSIAENDSFFTVSPQTFERQMKFLRTNRWNVVSLETLVSLVIHNQEIPRKTVVVTFDDAYVDFLEHALSVLEMYQIPATVFVPTSLVGMNMTSRDGVNLSILNWPQIKELVQHPLITIGSHTKNHPILTDVVDPERLRDEIEGSKKEIEQQLGVKCDFFAYPKGRNDTRIRKEAGNIYRASVGTEYGRVREIQTDVSNLNRNGVYNYTSIPRFKYLLRR